MRARKSLVAFLSDYLKAGIGFVTVFFVTRLIGAEAIGIVAYHLSLLGLFSFFLDIGISTAHIKRVSEKNDLGRCVGTYLFLKITALLIYLGIIIIYLYFFSGLHLTSPGHAIKDARIFIILLCYYLFDQFTSVLTATFSAREEVVKLNLPMILGRSGKMVVVMTLGFLGWGGIGLAISYCVDSLLSFGLSVILFKKAHIPVKKPDFEMIKSYWKYALPMMFIIPVSVLLSNVDRVMIQRLSNSTQVGFYYSVQSLLGIINSISSSAMIVLLPKISADFSMGKITELKTSIYKAVRYLAVLMMGLFAIMNVQADWIVQICFGKEFLATSAILQWMLLTYLIATVARPYSNILYGIEKHRGVAKISILNLLLLITCNWWLIPKMGASGAAISNVVIWVFSGSAQVFLAHRYLQLSMNGRRVLNMIVSCFLTWLATLFSRFMVLKFLPIHLVFQLMIVSAFGISAYILILTMLGEWQKADWVYVRRILNPSEAKKDFVREFR